MTNFDRKVRYVSLDSLRGLAALQVILLHYCSVFFPAFAAYAPIGSSAVEDFLRYTPVFLLIDGYSAVYLFFIISGFVLGPAFSRQGHVVHIAIARIIRLCLPVIVSAGFSIAALLVWSHIRESALRATGSQWLGGLLQSTGDPLDIAKDVFLNATIVGYDGASVFGSAPWLTPISGALNPPLWTLAMEVWGSFLLIALCFSLKRCTRLTKTVVSAGLVIAVTGPGDLSLFIIGYISALWAGHLVGGADSRCRRLVSAILLAAGFFLCITKESSILSRIIEWWPYYYDTSAVYEFHFVSKIGALLIFSGVIINIHIMNILEKDTLRKIGSLSFSLYLIHFPIMVAISVPVFVKVNAFMSFVAASIFSSAIGLFSTFVLAIYFNAYIEARALRYSRSWK